MFLNICCFFCNYLRREKDMKAEKVRFLLFFFLLFIFANNPPQKWSRIVLFGSFEHPTCSPWADWWPSQGHGDQSHRSRDCNSYLVPQVPSKRMTPFADDPAMREQKRYQGHNHHFGINWETRHVAQPAKISRNSR